MPKPVGASIVMGKWIFKHKFHSDGSLAHYKARWAIHGCSQRPGINFDETFSPIVKPATIRIVLSTRVSQSWPIHQLDVKNGFLHGNISVIVYCQHPSEFIDAAHPDHVCRLQKSLNGLKKSPSCLVLVVHHLYLYLGFVAHGQMLHFLSFSMALYLPTYCSMLMTLF